MGGLTVDIDDEEAGTGSELSDPPEFCPPPPPPPPGPDDDNTAPTFGGV